ncbi:MAG: hypothetical protein COB15_12295 [Flavobacteriales bacterium]|nr:MAG: hypothetical protein COB15_12295 [Flavobacteriales bacterium]
MKTKRLTLILLVAVIISACGGSAPPFDSKTPDTKNNVFHYEHLVGIGISEDVKNLYTYGDQFGIDASYYLAFNCTESTKDSIINSNQMIADSENGIGLYSSLELDWWDKEEIESLNRFVYTNENKTYFKYFWYNEESSQAYFLDFDL